MKEYLISFMYKQVPLTMSVFANDIRDAGLKWFKQIDILFPDWIFPTYLSIRVGENI